MTAPLLTPDITSPLLTPPRSSHLKTYIHKSLPCGVIRSFYSLGSRRGYLRLRRLRLALRRLLFIFTHSLTHARTHARTHSLMAGAIHRASSRSCGARGRRWPAAAFCVAGAIHRASWRSCGSRGRRWPAAAFCVAGAVHRASWRSCGSRGRRWPAAAFLRGRRSTEPPGGAAARVAAAGPRLPFAWQAQYREPPGGAAARVAAAGPRAAARVAAAGPNLLRNPVEPDLALHQSLRNLLRHLSGTRWTWFGFAIRLPGPFSPRTFSSGLLLSLTWLCTKASTFGTFSGTLLSLTWPCTKLPDLLRNLPRNPVEPDLALHQGFLDPSPPESCWTWPGSAPKPPRPSPEPSEPSPEPRWTWPGACTSAHWSYSGLKTPLALRGELSMSKDMRDRSWCKHRGCSEYVL